MEIPIRATHGDPDIAPQSSWPICRIRTCWKRPVRDCVCKRVALLRARADTEMRNDGLLHFVKSTLPVNHHFILAILVGIRMYIQYGFSMLQIYEVNPSFCYNSRLTWTTLRQEGGTEG